MDAPVIPDIPTVLDPLLPDANFVVPYVPEAHPVPVTPNIPVAPNVQVAHPVPPQVPVDPVVPPHVLVAPPVLPHVSVALYIPPQVQPAPPHVLDAAPIPADVMVPPPVPSNVAVPPQYCTVVVKVEQKQIVTQQEVINLLTDDEDDPEDGQPATAPAPMVETIVPHLWLKLNPE